VLTGGFIRLEAKDLIRGILKLEPSARLAIDEILSHPWFKKPIVDLATDAVPNGQTGAESVTPFLNTPEANTMTSYFNESALAPAGHINLTNGGDRSPAGPSPLSSPRIAPATTSLSQYQYPTSKLAPEAIPSSLQEVEGEISDTSAGTRASSDADHTSNSSMTAPTTVEGEEGIDHFDTEKRLASEHSLSTSNPHDVYLQSNESQSTIKKSPAPSVQFARPTASILDKAKEDSDQFNAEAPESRRHSLISFDEHGYHLAVHSRTPARTKRRSVSSSVASECRPSIFHSNSFSTAALPIVDYLEQLREAAPIFFTMDDEKDLLRSLEVLGFDVGQMKHSVLSDACDCSAAIWWMLRAKQQQKEEYERYQMEGLPGGLPAEQPALRVQPVVAPITSNDRKALPPQPSAMSDVFTSDQPISDRPTPAMEQRTIVKQIELGAPVRTSPGDRRPSLSTDNKAASSLGITSRALSPVFYTEENDRSGSSRSVPTSSAAHQSSNTSPAVMPSGMEPLKPADETSASVSSPGSPSRRPDGGKARSSSISMLQRATSVLATGLVRKKSEEKLLDDTLSKDAPDPRRSPTKLIKTPPLGRRKDSLSEGSQTQDNNEEPSGSGIAASSSYGTISASTLSLNDSPSTLKGNKNGKKESLLMTFRSWWNEDRKKRKRATGANPVIHHHGVNHTPSLRAQHIHAVKRTTVVQRRSPADARPHLGSRRSSSVNSRRSSVTSLHVPMMDLPAGSPMDAYSLVRRHSSRRSTGSRTPTSEFGDYGGSRPTSVRSMQMHSSVSQRTIQGRANSIHSGGSRTPTRSPGGRGQHHRTTSSSSARSRTRGGPHHRSASNATTASNRSAGSSRKSTMYTDERDGEPNHEAESDDMFVHAWRKRSIEERLAHPTQLVAKRTRSPLSTQFMLGRPRPLPPIRDVFADKGKNADGLPEEDWTSDEDESNTFAGGLGQCSTNNTGSRATTQDSPLQKSSGSFSSMPLAYTRSGGSRSNAPPKTVETKQKSTAAPLIEQPSDNRGARGRGAMPVNRPADITEEEEPEE